MMTTRISRGVEDQVFEDLVYLAQHAEAVQRIAEIVSPIPPGTGLLTVVKEVAAKLNDPSVDVERVLGTFQNVARTQARMRIDLGAFLDSLAGAYASWATAAGVENAEELWTKARETLATAMRNLGPDNPLEVARKAERLLYSHQNVLSEARIITDVRPVFDQAGDKIVKSVVAYTLLIDYAEAGTLHRIEIGLDTGDLADLRIVCERAERKAVALRDALKDKPWPTTLTLDGS
jgi:hypothetical protein